MFKERQTAWRAIRICLVVAMLGAAFFLTLRPSPYLVGLTWVPSWLADWADSNGVLRNVPAFAACYLVILVGVGWRRRYLAFGVTFAVATTLEVIQLWLPSRFFGWDDILASWGGVLAGFAIGSLGRWIMCRRSKPASTVAGCDSSASRRL
jgi:hypothetical protein